MAALVGASAAKSSGKRGESTLAVDVEQRRIFERGGPRGTAAQAFRESSKDNTAFLSAVEHEHITEVVLLGLVGR
ncbi:MAG: hypothetical protein SGPRY_001040 [Prymnesium sp.]